MKFKNSFCALSLAAVVGLFLSTPVHAENIGVGIVGRTIGHSGVKEDATMFRNNAKRSQMWDQPATGRELLGYLGYATSRLGCIPRITWAGHGWSADTSPAGGDGLPLDTNSNGFYLVDRQGSNGVNMADLAYEVKSRRIRFCGGCLIQVHACNVSVRFIAALSRTTGCEAVSGTGKVSPVDTNDGRYDHIWLSDDFPGSRCVLPDGSACRGDFVRIWPSGKFERLGRRYIAL